MSDSREELLKLLSEDPYGLLKNQESSKKKISNFVLLNNFEEIVSFVEENNRLPENSISGIKEFQLYCRLKAIKSNPEMVKQLKDYDLLGLLSGDDVAEITLEDITSVDPHHLLSDDFDSSIFDLRNVRSNPRTSPDFIARRKFCRDFDIYEPLFNTLHEDLEGGSKRLALYHPEDLIPGRFFVLGGILLYLKSVDGEVTLHKYQSGDYRRYDGRTECIFDNGTVSNMLYRSLNKLMQKDGYSITECEDVQSASTINPEEVGKIRRDPFAIIPFCGYNMGDYFQHWVDVGAKADQDKLPKIFYVNWFRKDENNPDLPGGFMWPGYGDNSRVLAWIFDRCDGVDNYVDTPIGYMPKEGALNTDGLADYYKKTLPEILKVDVEGWKKEV